MCCGDFILKKVAEGLLGHERKLLSSNRVDGRYGTMKRRSKCLRGMEIRGIPVFGCGA